MKITQFGRTYQHVQRYSQILTILFKFGYGDLVNRLRIDQVLKGSPFLKRTSGQASQMTAPQRIRAVLQELGPTFVKLGQILSTRYDLLPEPITSELSRLQDDVPPFSLQQARDIIEKEFGQSLENCFAEFADEPLAAASIGQVYRARLISGEDVAVKIQRPQIFKKMTTDLEIMIDIARLAERRIEELKPYYPTKMAEEFAQGLMEELDYQLEASHVERFSRLFADDKRVYVHRVFRQWSTSRVLTLEYIEGVKPESATALLAHDLDPKTIARNGAELVLKQVFEYRFFHADPHPGNLAILPDNAICYFDFGMMGRIDRASRDAVIDLLLAAFQRNEARTTEALLRLIRADQDVPRWTLERKVSVLLDRYIDRPIEEIQIDALLRQLFDLAFQYQLELPADLFMLIKTLVMVEGLARELDPTFNLAEVAKPTIRNVKLRSIDPQRIARGIMDTATDLTYLLKEIPGEIRDILKQVKRGKIKMEFEHRGLKPMLEAHQHIANRIASAIVLASLIIGSSLIVLSGIPPTWHDIPLIGLAGYLVSGVMGFSLLLSIRKSGR